MIRQPLIIAVVMLLAGCSTIATPSTPTPTETPEVVDREVTTGTVSLDGLPVSQKFRFQNGEVHAEFPIRVEFQRPDAGNWTTVHVFNVGEMEWFTVELTGGTSTRCCRGSPIGARVGCAVYSAAVTTEAVTRSPWPLPIRPGKLDAPAYALEAPEGCAQGHHAVCRVLPEWVEGRSRHGIQSFVVHAMICISDSAGGSEHRVRYSV